MSFELDYSETINDIAHPLDCVERISDNLDFSFDRCSEDLLIVKAKGDYGPYALDFNWHNDMGGIEITCKTGWRAEENEMATMARTIVDINAQLHIGHFDILTDGTISFRHTILLRGAITQETFDPISEIIEIAVTNVDKFHALFAMVKSERFDDGALLDLALSSVEGHA